MFSKTYTLLYPSVALISLLLFSSPSAASTLPPAEFTPQDSETAAATAPAVAPDQNSQMVLLAAADSSPDHRTSPSPPAVTVTTVADKKGVLPLNDGSGNRVPDWNGVWLDTGIFLGTQFVACGIIYFTPESFSGWSPEQKKNTFSHYTDNFLHPVMDKDDFYINYLLHPYWGATYYTRGRERGLDATSSFFYSFAMSALYEFGPECFFEKPSIQDLIVTPGLGSLLGALVFEPLRNSIKGKEELRWYDHVALVATDPLGLLSLGVEKMIGVKSTILVDYSTPKHQAGNSGISTTANGSRIMLSMQMRFN